MSADSFNHDSDAEIKGGYRERERPEGGHPNDQERFGKSAADNAAASF